MTAPLDISARVEVVGRGPLTTGLSTSQVLDVRAQPYAREHSPNKGLTSLSEFSIVRLPDSKP